MIYSELIWASLVAQSIKSLPAIQETLGQCLGQEDSLEKEIATLSMGNPMDGGNWLAIVHGVIELDITLATKPPEGKGQTSLILSIDIQFP